MKFNRSHRKDEGVSPVIAIILMVAITVVLAGVLYVWVTQLADTEEDSLDLLLFRAEVREETRNLTIEMRSGHLIQLSDYKLTMDDVELNMLNGTNVTSLNVGGATETWVP